MLEVGSAARHVNACCLPYHKGDSSAAAWLCGAQTGVRGPPGGPEEAKLGVVSECNRLQVEQHADNGAENQCQLTEDGEMLSSYRMFITPVRTSFDERNDGKKKWTTLCFCMRNMSDKTSDCFLVCYFVSPPCFS